MAHQFLPLKEIYHTYKLRIFSLANSKEGTSIHTCAHMHLCCYHVINFTFYQPDRHIHNLLFIFRVRYQILEMMLYQNETHCI